MKCFILFISFVIFPSLLFAESKNFNGSLSLHASQRFFDDDRLGHVNGFSEWGAIQFGIDLGLHEFILNWGKISSTLEPVIGFEFIRNSTTLYALDANGDYVLDANGDRMVSQDRLQYQFYTFSTGFRYKAWAPDFFWAIPYAEAYATARLGRVRKKTLAIDQQKMNTGVDFGGHFGGGAIFSFMFDRARKQEMSDNWELKDYGLMTFVHFLPAGLFKQGLGLVDNTGGWDLGLGLFVDW